MVLPKLFRSKVMTAAISVSDRCFGECLHGGIGFAVHDPVHVAIGDQLAVLDSHSLLQSLLPERAGNALGTPLPSAWWHGALLLIDFLALGDQLVLAPGAVAPPAAAVDSAFFIVDPGEVFRFRHGVDDHRHEAVVLAAQFGALAAVDAGFSILTQVSRRNPGMASRLTRTAAPTRCGSRRLRSAGHALSAYRQDHRIIDLEQIMFAPSARVADLVARRESVLMNFTRNRDIRTATSTACP